MKKLPQLTVLLFFLAVSFYSTAQENGSYTFQILDYKGSPIQKARLIVLSDESHMASPEGLITYLGEVDYVKKNGVMVKTRVMPHYIHVKAPGYKDRKVDLTQYALGAYIVVKLEKLEKLSSEYKELNVYVKDKDGKGISGATVYVNPGKTTNTDGSGYAKVQHTILISGEYVKLEVHKEGYKIERQYVPSGDAPWTKDGKAIPANTAYITLTKGENESIIFHINVEVLDADTDEPVPGANVQLSLSDGDVKNGTTNTQGECRLSDNEYSFAGLTAKVIVKKKGYKEKWSDITADLMTGKDNAERQFLIYISKDGDADWSGTYESGTPWGKQVLVVSGSGTGFTATTSHIKNNGFTDKGQISGCRAEGDKLQCNWTEQFEDNDKKISRRGTVVITMSGNTLSGSAVEDEPGFSWKNGITPYSSAIRKGAVWTWAVTKKN